MTIISCDYFNLSLANEYVDDVTIPTQIIKYNPFFYPVESANQIAVFKSKYILQSYNMLSNWTDLI